MASTTDQIFGEYLTAAIDEWVEKAIQGIPQGKILCITGPQGSGKTVMLKRLAQKITGTPFIQHMTTPLYLLELASTRPFLALDNVDWKRAGPILADTLCQSVSPGIYTMRRKFYTDEPEVQKPRANIALTCIDGPIRVDLQDRMIFVHTHPLDHYLPESELLHV